MNNGSIQTNVPAAKCDFAAGEAILAVRMHLRPSPLTAQVFPEGNRIGTRMLCRLLLKRMEADCIRVIQCGASMPLNRASSLFVIANRQQLNQALEVTESELAELQILYYAQIAWYDFREGVYRVHKPVSSAPFEAQTEAENQSEAELLRELGYEIDQGSGNDSPSFPNGDTP